MRIIPTKSQWKGWTLPSKAGYVSLLIAIISLVVIFILPNETNIKTSGDIDQNVIGENNIQAATTGDNSPISIDNSTVLSEKISDISFELTLAFKTEITGNFVYDHDSGPIVISSGGIALYVELPSGKTIRYSNIYPDARYFNKDGTIVFRIPFELRKGQNLKNVKYRQFRDESTVMFDFQKDGIAIFGGGVDGMYFNPKRLNGLRSIQLVCYENSEVQFTLSKSFGLIAGAVPSALTVKGNSGSLSFEGTTEIMPLENMSSD